MPNRRAGLGAVAVRRVAVAGDEARADRDVAAVRRARARAGARARAPDAGRRRRRGRSTRSRARAPSGSRRRCPKRRPRFSPNECTSAPCSRATSAVRSVEPSSTTSTSASGSSACSSSSTAGQVLLLVPGRDEDERVAHRTAAAPSCTCARRDGDARPSSQAIAPGVGATRATAKLRLDPVRAVEAAEDSARGTSAPARRRRSPASTPRSSSSGSVRAAFSAVVVAVSSTTSSTSGRARSAHLLRLGRAAEDDDGRRLARASRSASPTSRSRVRARVLPGTTTAGGVLVCLPGYAGRRPTNV